MESDLIIIGISAIKKYLINLLENYFYEKHIDVRFFSAFYESIIIEAINSISTGNNNEPFNFPHKGDTLYLEFSDIYIHQIKTLIMPYIEQYLWIIRNTVVRDFNNPINAKIMVTFNEVIISRIIKSGSTL